MFVTGHATSRSLKPVVEGCVDGWSAEVIFAAPFRLAVAGSPLPTSKAALDLGQLQSNLSRINARHGTYDTLAVSVIAFNVAARTDVNHESLTDNESKLSSVGTEGFS